MGVNSPNMKSEKFLVELINNVTKKDLFLIAWIGLGLVPFIYLWWRDYQKSSLRNFKESRGKQQKGSADSLTTKNTTTNQLYNDKRE